MPVRCILFDLDGTLLPMDQEPFMRAYFGGLSRKLAPLGYDPKALIDGIWAGTAAMVENDGSRTNEEAFWDTFCRQCRETARQDEPVFEAYYKQEFQQVKDACGFDPAAAQSVRALRAMGFRVALATNPIFPAVATHSRIRWTGLEPGDFELVTTYENSCHCKPNPDYYRDILNALGLAPEECLMVGNDVGEDMAAQALGMRVFLLTDCLINQKEEDISRYPQGSFAQLMEYVRGLNQDGTKEGTTYGT